MMPHRAALLHTRDEELATRCTMCAVFPEDTEVPLEILSDLWGTDEAETREVVERLGGEHLVELVADGARIRLLDPVRDYLRCRGKSALEGWRCLSVEGSFFKPPALPGVSPPLAHFRN